MRPRYTGSTLGWGWDKASLFHCLPAGPTLSSLDLGRARAAVPTEQGFADEAVESMNPDLVPRSSSHLQQSPGRGRTPGQFNQDRGWGLGTGILRKLLWDSMCSQVPLSGCTSVPTVWRGAEPGWYCAWILKPPRHTGFVLPRVMVEFCLPQMPMEPRSVAPQNMTLCGDWMFTRKSR